MAFGKKNTGPQRGGAQQGGNPAMMEGAKKSPWVIAVIAVAVVAAIGFTVAGLTISNNSGSGGESQAPATKTVDTSRITGMDNLTFLSEDAKMRLASSLEDYLTGRGYAWPCTVTILDKAEQYNNGGTKFYFLTGEGKAWIVLYSPTAASEFSVSELTTVVEGVNDEVAVADGDEKDTDPSAPKGSGYTVEDDEPAVVDARPSSSSSSGSSGSSASPSASSSSSSNTQSGTSGSSTGNGSSGSSSSTTPSVQKIAAGTVPVTDAASMEAFLPGDAATVFPQAVSQYLAKWDLSASKAKACKGSSSKSGTTYTFNMTAGSHAATVTYDSSKHKFHFQTLY